MWHRRRALDGLEQDIRHHIEQETSGNIARGMAPEEARRQALIKFGNVTTTIEDTRAVWSWAWIGQAVHDVRYGLRLVRRQPGFSAVVILTVALGIAMNSMVFSISSAALLKQLSYPNAERLVWIGIRDDALRSGTEATLAADFAVWRDQASAFELMAGYDPTSTQALVARGNATQANVAWVTDDFWRLTGAQLAHGRVPNADERGVVIVTYALFADRFQSDPSVIDSTVTFNGQPIRIVGVLEQDFVFELPIEQVDVTTPRRRIDAYRTLVLGPQDRGRSQFLHVVGRLKPDIPLARAQTELQMIRARIAQETPMPFIDRNTLHVTPLRDKLTVEARRTLWILSAAVGLVLLIVCANIAGLLLARWSVRQKEIAIRASLGASRRRLVGQSIAEISGLALAGGIVGVLLAYWGLGAIVHLTPHAVPRLAESRIDGGIVGLSLLVSLAAAGVSSVGPALSDWRVETMASLQLSGRSHTAPPVQLRARRLLVATELALAALLLTGAGLLVKSNLRLHEHPAGFEPGRILSFTVALSGPTYRDAQRRQQFANELLDRMASANVEAFGLNTIRELTANVQKEGAPRPRPGEARKPAALNATSAGYAATMGLRVLKGRWITDSEPEAVVVINEALARRDFQAEDPIGRRLSLPSLQPGGTLQPSLATIVGVVSDVKYVQLDENPSPELYVPYRQHPLFRFNLLARATADPSALVPGMRRMMAEIDATQPMFDVTTIEQALSDSVTPRRFNLILFTTLAAAAVMLALIGVYGVIAFIVSHRTQEIGVRLALGAERGAVVRMVIRQSLGMTIGGLVAGLAAAVALTRAIESLLYEVGPTDPATFTIVAIALTLAALAACAWPAMRAARVDPLTALRLES